MLKPAPITPKSHVYWLKTIIEGMAWKAKLDAKVLEVRKSERFGEEAVISVAADCVYGAPKREFVVPIAELENKARIVDEEWKRQRDEKRIANAEIVSESMCGECLFVDPEVEDKVFWDSGEYLEYCEEEEIEPASLLWVADSMPLRRKNSDCFVDDIIEQVGDEYSIDVKGVDELQKAIDAFYEANSAITVLHVDYKKAIEVKRDDKNTMDD